MTKTVLITAGAVYGKLDDNKLVSNRARGHWAARFAGWLANRQGYQVVLLCADTQRKEVLSHITHPHLVTVEAHRGFEEYRAMCNAFASSVDAAVMAAAVVNWIPERPFPGKMPTEGYEPGDRISIPFVLAPRVIDDMKKRNPRMTLIGCKLTSGHGPGGDVEQAYKLLLRARCNAVIANDLVDLDHKTVVHQDTAVLPFNIKTDAAAFYAWLRMLIDDEHYTTVSVGTPWSDVDYNAALRRFNHICDRHRDGFVEKLGHVFGSLAVRIDEGGALMSPREKGIMFDAQQAVDVCGPDTEDLVSRRMLTVHGHKATLNAVLLLRHLEQYPQASAVLHQHRQLDGVPTVPYAPPGTVRDNMRHIPGPIYNIEHHGFIAALDEDGNFLYEAAT